MAEYNGVMVYGEFADGKLAALPLSYWVAAENWLMT